MIFLKIKIDGKINEIINLLNQINLITNKIQFIEFLKVDFPKPVFA